MHFIWNLVALTEDSLHLAITAVGKITPFFSKILKKINLLVGNFIV